MVAVNYFNPIAGVVNLCEKCPVSCFRHLDNACDYSEPNSMPMASNGPFDLECQRK